MTNKVMYQNNDEPENFCVRYWSLQPSTSRKALLDSV